MKNSPNTVSKKNTVQIDVSNSLDVSNKNGKTKDSSHQQINY